MKIYKMKYALKKVTAVKQYLAVFINAPVD
jgi:hypothetical protein